MSMRTIQITLRGVQEHDGVSEAVCAAAEGMEISTAVACDTVRELGIEYYAKDAAFAELRASSESKATVLDPTNGQWVTGRWANNKMAEVKLGDWSGESCVELVCPNEADALASPDGLAKMAAEVSTHSDRTDVAAWRELIARIRGAASFEDVDLPNL